MWALVPLKSPATAKSRLSPVLNPVQRQRIFFAMARHVINVLLETPEVEQIVVVTASQAVHRFAEDLGITVMELTQDRGTTDACQTAIARLNGVLNDAVLILPGDLPLATSEALSTLIRMTEAQSAVTIVPDRKGTGTNALVCRPPQVIPIAFGEGSLKRHIEAAAACGATLRVVHSPELEFDIDDASDLAQLRAIYRSHPLGSQNGGQTHIDEELLALCG